MSGLLHGDEDIEEVLDVAEEHGLSRTAVALEMSRAGFDECEIDAVLGGDYELDDDGEDW